MRKALWCRVSSRLLMSSMLLRHIAVIPVDGTLMAVTAQQAHTRVLLAPCAFVFGVGLIICAALCLLFAACADRAMALTDNVWCDIAEVEVVALLLEADAVLRDQLPHKVHVSQSRSLTRRASLTWCDFFGRPKPICSAFALDRLSLPLFLLFCFCFCREFNFYPRFKASAVVVSAVVVSAVVVSAMVVSAAAAVSAAAVAA